MAVANLRMATRYRHRGSGRRAWLRGRVWGCQVPARGQVAHLATIRTIAHHSLWDTGAARASLLFDEDFQLPRADRLQHHVVVAFGLVSIGDRELDDRLVELFALTQVAADLGWFA